MSSAQVNAAAQEIQKEANIAVTEQEARARAVRGLNTCAILTASQAEAALFKKKQTAIREGRQRVESIENRTRANQEEEVLARSALVLIVVQERNQLRLRQQLRVLQKVARAHHAR